MYIKVSHIMSVLYMSEDEIRCRHWRQHQLTGGIIDEHGTNDRSIACLFVWECETNLLVHLFAVSNRSSQENKESTDR